jgi:hypothetical protein
MIKKKPTIINKFTNVKPTTQQEPQLDENLIQKINTEKTIFDKKETSILDNILNNELVKFDNKNQTSMFYVCTKVLNVFHSDLVKNYNITISKSVVDNYITTIVPQIIKEFTGNLKKRCKKTVNTEILCLGRKLDNRQCTRKKHTGYDFCKSHLRKLSNGRIDQINTNIQIRNKRGRKRKVEFDPRQYDNEYITLWEDIINGEKVFVDNNNNVYTFDTVSPKYLGKKKLEFNTEFKKLLDDNVKEANAKKINNKEIAIIKDITNINEIVNINEIANINEIVNIKDITNNDIKYDSKKNNDIKQKETKSNEIRSDIKNDIKSESLIKKEHINPIEIIEPVDNSIANKIKTVKFLLNNIDDNNIDVTETEILKENATVNSTKIEKILNIPNVKNHSKRFIKVQRKMPSDQHSLQKPIRTIDAYLS